MNKRLGMVLFLGILTLGISFSLGVISAKKQGQNIAKYHPDIF